MITCFDNFGNEHQFSKEEFVTRTAVYGVYLKDDSVLMVKDSKSKFWELPGGGVGRKESEQKALKREFIEETGLHIDGEPCFLISFIEYFFDSSSKQPWKTTRKFYQIENATGSLIDKNQDDVEAVQFIPLDKVGQFNIKDKIKAVIKSFRLSK